MSPVVMQDQVLDQQRMQLRLPIKEETLRLGIPLAPIFG
jgi:hypothetical protein